MSIQATKPKKFYGMALSFFPQHGLKATAMVDKGDREIVEDRRRSFHIPPDEVNNQSFKRLEKAVRSISKAQQDENKKDGLAYSVPIIAGWAGEKNTPWLNHLFTDDRAEVVTTYSGLNVDPLGEQVRKRLLTQVKDSDPNAVNETVMLGSFPPLPEGGFPTEPSEHEIDESLRLLRDLADQGNQQALDELKNIGISAAIDFVENSFKENGKQARLIRFFYFGAPELKHLNTPEVVSVMKQTIKKLLKIHRHSEIDIKFVNDKKDPPFFNITRPNMATEIQIALKQKFYSIATSFYGKALKTTVMVDDGEGRYEGGKYQPHVRVDKDLSWEITEEADVKKGLTRLLKTITEVAKLQDAENQRCQNFDYEFHVNLGWPGDDEIAKSLKTIRVKKENEDIFGEIESRIEKKVKDSTSDNFKLKVHKADFGSRGKLADEDPPELKAKKLELQRQALAGNPQAQEFLINLARQEVDELCTQLIEEGETSPMQVRFIQLADPSLAYLNTPLTREFMSQYFQFKLGTPFPVEIKFPGDEKDPEFFNVVKPKMEAFIDRALTFF